MRRALLAAVVLSACAPVSGRLDILSTAPSFRAKSVAVAATRGARGKGVEISRGLSRRLQARGTTAVPLEESDSVLAGSALSLEGAMNTRLLDEVRRATGADAIVFLSLDPAWRSLDVSVLDARTGEAVLRAAARARGDSFTGADEISDAAAHALLGLSEQRRRPTPDHVDDGIEEIPVP